MLIWSQFWKFWIAGALLLLNAVACGQSLMPPTGEEIVYLAGGIGSDELAAMHAQAAGFNVRLEFVELEQGSQHGNWTADAAVDVWSHGQMKAHIEVPGPLLLLRMPAGSYTIEASRNGQRVAIDVTVPRTGRQVLKRFVWRVPAGTLGSRLRSE